MLGLVERLSPRDASESYMGAHARGHETAWEVEEQVYASVEAAVATSTTHCMLLRARLAVHGFRHSVDVTNDPRGIQVGASTKG